jgi:hypothetical protein
LATGKSFSGREGSLPREISQKFPAEDVQDGWGMQCREPGRKKHGFFVRDAERGIEYFKSIFYGNDRIYTDLRSRSILQEPVGRSKFV